MIKRINITNLFGIENNNKNIEFNEDVTILVGLNGSGKTTILNILNAIFSKNFHELTNYEFKNIEIECDEENIKIIKLKKFIFILRTDIAKEREPNLVKLLEELDRNDGEIENRILLEKIFALNFDLDPNIKRKLCNREEDNYQQLYLYESKDIYDMSVNNNREEYFLIVNKNEDRNVIQDYDRFNFKMRSIYFPTYRRLEADFMDLLGSNQMYVDGDDIFQVSLRNRFLANIKGMGFSGNKTKTVIGYSNKDIEQLVKQKWNRINRIEAQLLNSLYLKFIHSLLEPLSDEYNNVESSYNEKEYKNQLLEIFEKTGLLSNRKDETIEKISSYVEDVIWAEEEYPSLFNKGGIKHNIKNDVELLLKASKIRESQKQINKLVKMYQDTIKRVKVLKKPFETLTELLNIFLQKEVYFVDGNMSFRSGKDRLTFEDLSAGEKQLVSMFVYIWLDLESGSIIMIDEPELSLHVTWQRELLSALTMNEKKVQYIISTHSPFIIGKYKDKIEKVGVIEEGFN